MVRGEGRIVAAEAEEACSAPAPLLDSSSRRRRRSGGERENGGATRGQTLGNVVVATVGTGVLGLPYAFRVAGWAAGSLGVAVAGVATCYCMLLLVLWNTLISLEGQHSNHLEREESKDESDQACFMVQENDSLEVWALIRCEIFGVLMVDAIGVRRTNSIDASLSRCVSGRST